MKKVLQIPNYQYPHIGGIEQVARDIADALLEDKEIQQKMICFNEDAKDGDYVCHRKETVHDEVNGVEVIRCECFAKVASQSLSATYPDVTGIECPNRDVRAYAEAMRKLADDASLRKVYGEAARNRVKENFMYDGLKENSSGLIAEM